MFRQLIDPVAHNLFLSFLVGFIPIVVVLVLLGIVRLPAWQAALAGLVVGLLVAVTVWSMPVGLALRSMSLGAAFALLPVMWIVWNAMWLYNVAVQTGKFELFRRWMVYNVPPDRRILVLVVGFSFGALMEGIAGFGTPVAIGSALLIGLGFAPLEALTLTLIFDTAPVAFGALGVPITTLGLVTSLPTAHLSAMVGRQLPLFAFILPFYALIVLSGLRGLRSAWPAALLPSRNSWCPISSARNCPMCWRHWSLSSASLPSSSSGSRAISISTGLRYPAFQQRPWFLALRAKHLANPSHPSGPHQSGNGIFRFQRRRMAWQVGRQRASSPSWDSSPG